MIKGFFPKFLSPKLLISIVISFSSLFGCATSSVLGPSSCDATNQVCRVPSFRSALDDYGFTTEYQKQGLAALFRQAGVIPENQSIDEDAQPKEYTALVSDLVDKVEGAQKYFVIRSGTQERWEINTLDWMEKNKEKNMTYLEALGFVNAILPTDHDPGAVCILGALHGTMANRIRYMEYLVDSGRLKTKSVILLSGERYLTLNKDGSEQELNSIAHQFQLDSWKKLTETHLIKSLYTQSRLSGQLPFHVIDTPASEQYRPTTQTTMVALSNWLKQHPEIKTLLFISSQPYIQYQSAIIRSILEEERTPIQFEVVGPAVVNRDRIQPIFEGLGSYLWAALPEVLSKIEPKITINNPELKNRLRQLYARNPLIFQRLPEILREK